MPLLSDESLTKVRDMAVTSHEPQHDPDAIGTVRAFNRTVTTRIGALQDHYLGSDRSLGASRVLWEVSDDGLDVRVIRERLGLDSGYLSRLLRSLEREGLVTVEGSAGDSRVRTVRTTARGRAERTELGRRSDDLAGSLLAPLGGGQRARLVEAMATVTRLLDAASNPFNWQWVAGSGADAAPYFRVFNPELQATKFDPHGVYVQRWVPEAGTDDYPEPIVDLKETREAALAAYEHVKAARGQLGRSPTRDPAR